MLRIDCTFVLLRACGSVPVFLFLMCKVPDALLVAPAVRVCQNYFFGPKEAVSAPWEHAEPQIVMLSSEYVSPEEAGITRVIHVGKYFGFKVAFASDSDAVVEAIKHSRRMGRVASNGGMAFDFVVRVVGKAEDRLVELFLYHFLPGKFPQVVEFCS